ncbi:MAG TPA: hypothetical protein PKD51_06340 [Saprospiraceae bacterium]|nr:hypothetical protein [Saprospiraceae bacterium]
MIYKFIGYTERRGKNPIYKIYIPIFEYEGKNYIQEIDTFSRKIIKFKPVDLIIEFKLKEEIFKKEGDLGMFIFWIRGIDDPKHMDSLELFKFFKSNTFIEIRKNLFSQFSTEDFFDFLINFSDLARNNDLIYASREYVCKYFNKSIYIKGITEEPINDANFNSLLEFYKILFNSLDNLDDVFNLSTFIKGNVLLSYKLNNEQYMYFLSAYSNRKKTLTKELQSEISKFFHVVIEMKKSEPIKNKGSFFDMIFGLFNHNKQDDQSENKFEQKILSKHEDKISKSIQSEMSVHA